MQTAAMLWPEALLVSATIVCAATSGSAQQLPSAIATGLSSGYRVMAVQRAKPDAAHEFMVVALESLAERRRFSPAPPRPLLIYRKQGVAYRLTARNDHIILRADEGGQCDPFEFGRITAKDRFITVSNSVACGAHWTDDITFRFDPASHWYVFDHRRTESWSFNSDTRPDAEALVSDGVRVRRSKGKAVTFSHWRPNN
jgi:hypothetical protein